MRPRRRSTLAQSAARRRAPASRNPSSKPDEWWPFPRHTDAPLPEYASAVPPLDEFPFSPPKR